MEVSMLQIPPGDPGLIDKIVCQLKSNGIFDQFRKECIADVDTKPAYQNLRQRVEGSVSSFLTNQEWRADLNKNQLRDSLRKQIHESGFLDIGVERIVDQVVNPKVYTVFFPKVEDVVYGFLGVEKPKKGADIQNSLQANLPKFEENPKPEKKFVSLKDLLPTDLDPISPEKFDSDEDIDENSADKTKVNDSNEVDQPSGQKVKVKEETISDVENDYDEDEKEDEEDDDEEASPPFESLEGDALDANANATPPVLPLHSADMLDNITSSSSSSETKDLLQYGEVRKRYPDLKPDSIKKEVDGEVEKHLPPEQVKTETCTETCVVKKEEREKKEMVEPKRELKKLEKKEEKSRDNGERKDEARNRKSISDSRESRDKHVHDKKRSDRDQVIVKQEKEDGKRNDKEEQRKTVKEEHKKSEKDDHRKVEKDEAKKTEKEKDELRKSEKSDKKHAEKDDGRKVDNKERDSSRRHDRDKEDRKSMKERDEKRSEKDKKHTREKEESKRSEKDDHRKVDKEKDESRRSESKKRDKKDEKKPEKEKDEKKPEREKDEKKPEREKDEKKLEKEKDEKKHEREKEEKKVAKEKEDSKKSEKEDARRSEKEESRKSDREKDKHRSGKEKPEHIKGEKDAKERIKSEHKEKDGKHGSSKSGVETPKKDSNEKDHQSKVSVDKKKEENMKKPHHRDSNKTSSSKDKKVGEKEKKVTNTDDHRHERDKGKNGHRRSDRDKDRERERSQADGATHAALGKEGSIQPSSTSSTPSSEGSKGSGDSSSGGGGGSECTKEEEPKVKACAGKEGKQASKDSQLSDIYSSLCYTSGSLVLKIKKPKIAANIYEVKKIMQVRKNLKKLERERLASSNACKVSNQKADEIVAESASKLEDISETKSAAEPPKVKRAKLGAVEQDLRGEVESVLEKSLLEGEDGEIGEVRYLEDNPNLPDFVLYVRSLAEEAAAGDYSRVPSPTNSIATIELSDFEDNVILSDVELSKEEEDVVSKLGGHVERKTNKLKSPKKSSPTLPLSDLSGEGSKRPRRPNPRYNSGEYTVYSDEDVDEDDMTDSVSQKKVALVDGVGRDHWKTPKERSLEVDEEVDANGHNESGSAALPTPENDAAPEDRETPVLSKKNQAAAEERRRMGRRLGVRGPLRRVAGISPGTPDTFVMPLSPESDVSTASGDAGKKASLNSKAIENQYHQGDMDGELGPEYYDDARGSEDGDAKQSRLPLGPPLSSAHKGCDIKSQAGDLNQSHDDIGQPSSGLTDGDRRIDDPSGLGPRRLRGTRSSSRVQQRYSSDDLYKPRPNITLGRRNRGRNSPTQDESSMPENAHNYTKQGRRGSAQGSDEMLVEGCMPNKRRRR